jgi:hypothetical protein
VLYNNYITYYDLTSDVSRVFQEPKNVDSLSHTQSSVICNPTKEVTTVEVGIQAEMSEELDYSDIQKILQLLEKSRKLSPELAKSLKDHFLSIQMTKRCELSKSLNRIESVVAKKLGAASVSKEKSPPYLRIHPLNAKVLQSSQIHISEVHDMDSATESRPLWHASKPLYSMVEIGPSFQGYSLHGNMDEKNRKKRIKLSNPDDRSLELDRVQKVGGGSKGSEGSACVSDLHIVDTGDPSAGIARSACIDGDLNGDGINHLNARKDVQESSLSSNSKYMFLKMLEIDKEIQKLMEMKLKLYTKLEMSLTTDGTCSNMNIGHSPKLPGLQCASPTGVASSHTLCNRMTLGNNSNTQQIYMGFVKTNNNKSTSSSCTSEIATSPSTPMAMLPADYVMGSLPALQNTNFSLPKHKLNKSRKTVDTSFLEAVGNSCTIPNSQIRGEDSAVIHYAGHSDQSEILGDVSEASCLKSGLDQVDSDGANRVRRYLAPRLSDCQRESHQSERNSSPPKAMSLKKQILKPKCNLSKKGCSGGKKNQPREGHNTGIATRIESCRRVGNQEKEGIGSSCEATTKKLVCLDSLIGMTVKKLRSRNKHTIQRMGNIKYEQEFLQSGSSIMVEDKKESVSAVRTKVLTKSNKQSETDNSTSCDKKESVSAVRTKGLTKSNKQSETDSSTSCDEKEFISAVRTKVLTKSNKQSETDSSSCDKKESVSAVRTKGLTRSNKQSETDSSTSCHTSTRHSPRNHSVSKSTEELSSEESICVLRHRGDAKTRSLMGLEIQLEGVSDKVSSRKKTQLPKGKSFPSFKELEAPDCISRVTRKRKLTVKADTVDDEHVAGSQEELTESGSRRSFCRVISDFQEIKPGCMDENASEISTRRKSRVKIEQVDAVNESTLPDRQLKKTTVSNSGYLQKRNNPRGQSSPEIVTSGLSSRTRQHVDEVHKKKLCEVEGPPSKVQHLDPKVNPLQWSLQNCFVMVKPLAVEEIGSSNKPQEDLTTTTTTDSLHKQIIRRSSSSSHESSAADFVEREKEGTESKIWNLRHKSDDPYRVVLPEFVDADFNETEGCSSREDPLRGIPSAETQVPVVGMEPGESIASDPWHLPPDLTVQSHSPERLVGQCMLPEIAIQDENSISTFVSDTSDGEQYITTRNRNDEKSEADVLTHSADGKDDWDQSSPCSYDTAPEGREATNSKAPKHKSSRKHKKDRKSDGIERLVFESHEGPVLDIKVS